MAAQQAEPGKGPAAPRALLVPRLHRGLDHVVEDVHRVALLQHRVVEQRRAQPAVPRRVRERLGLGVLEDARRPLGHARGREDVTTRWREGSHTQRERVSVCVYAHAPLLFDSRMKKKP